MKRFAVLFGLALALLAAAESGLLSATPELTSGVSALTKARPILVEPGCDRAVRSSALRNALLHSPFPGGRMAGYAGDTGLDIAGNRRPVYALAAGVLEYSERGHTVWVSGADTPLSIRIRLSEPRWVGSHQVTHVYYTHLSYLRFARAADSSDPEVRIAAGECIGVSGVGNGVPHLHLGILFDGDVSQTSFRTLMREDAIRTWMGGYQPGERLPVTTDEKLDMTLWK